MWLSVLAIVLTLLNSSLVFSGYSDVYFAVDAGVSVVVVVGVVVVKAVEWVVYHQDMRGGKRSIEEYTVEVKGFLPSTYEDEEAEEEGENNGEKKEEEEKEKLKKQE